MDEVLFSVVVIVVVFLLHAELLFSISEIHVIETNLNKLINKRNIWIYLHAVLVKDNGRHNFYVFFISYSLK